MPRHYQIKRNNPYYIDDKNIYMQIVYMIKGYHDLIAQREKILHGSAGPSDGQPRGTITSNPAKQKAPMLYSVEQRIKAIEQTIIELCGKYSDTCTGEPFDAYGAFIDYAVFCYYRSNPNKDIAPSEKTWRRYRAEFAYLVAKKINFL